MIPVAASSDLPAVPTAAAVPDTAAATAPTAPPAATAAGDTGMAERDGKHNQRLLIVSSRSR